MNTPHPSPVRIINPHGPTPKGFQDFTQVMQQKRCFVDKSLFIREILDNDDKVVLITRPRRFGKTTNQSLLQAFFEQPAANTDSAALFEGLLIAEQDDVMQHQGRYPLISLTFKDLKALTWEKSYIESCSLISKEIDRHPECQQFDIPGFGAEEQRQWLSLIHISEPTRRVVSRMPSSA